MLRLFVLSAILLTTPGCFPGSDEWGAGPIKTLGAEEKIVLQDAFSINTGAKDLTLFLKGGKDYSLYARWHSDTPMIDAKSKIDTFELTSENTIPSRISLHAPNWWGADEYDHVFSNHSDHAYIGVILLDDGTYRYDAIRYSASVKLPASTYQYFE